MTPATPPSRFGRKAIAYFVVGFIRLAAALTLRLIPLEHGIGILRFMGLFLLLPILFVACMAIATRGENPGRPGQPPMLRVLFPGVLAFVIITAVTYVIIITR